MNSTSIPLVVARERVLPVIAVAATLTWLGDFLLWGRVPGISAAIYACAVAVTLLVLPGSERPSRNAWIAAALLNISCVATALEISFTNLAVLTALLAVIMGERHFRELAAGWSRWSEAFVAWLGAPGRWPWLARSFAESELANVGFNTVTSDRAARSFQIVAPAACLAVVFSVVFGFGNAVFGELLARFGRELSEWILSFDFSFGRFALWIVFATFALSLVRPRPAPAHPRLWSRPLPQIFRADLGVAVWQGCAVFAVLNVLFFVVNTIDVVYLWSQAALPGNVSFSAFVHQGVYSLIFAVLLSAIVIAAVFQQEANVTRHRVLKTLAWVWIAQNLLLIAGVFLRLKLYVDAYQLSELRVYVGCFLLLVAVGFGLLAWHVGRSGNLSTLIWHNAIATFVLFFILQFPDIAGWVARFNVEQWRREPGRTLDLAYLESLGAGAWPSLCEVASSKNVNAATAARAREIVERIASAQIERREQSDWRSYQARRDLRARRLIAEAARLPVRP
jgi:uncharacterized membrane protein